MGLTRWALLLIAAGVALFCVSLVWPRAARSNATWTEEKAKEHAAAAGKVHRLSHERIHNHGAHPPGTSHANEASSTESLDEARLHFEKTSAELQRAQTAGQGLAAVFRWLGIISAGLGSAAYFGLRLAEGK